MATDDPRVVEEVWETTGSGSIWVKVTALDGKNRSKKVGGRTGMKLRLSKYDRLRNQEICVEPESDPFTNGMLVRADADQQEDETTRSVNALSVDDLAHLFNLKGKDFRAKLDELNELNVRRLIQMSEDMDATRSQTEALDDVLAERWPIGGDSRMYRELQGLGQVAVDTQ